MGLEIAVTRKKCQRCKINRAQRYCLKYGKDICWKCCNRERIQRKCPSECNYIIQATQDEQAQSLKAKVDSFAEHLNMLELQIDIWAEMPDKQFGDKIPSQMAITEEGSKELEKYVDSLTLLAPQTRSYLRKKLKLKKKEDVSVTSYEDIAARYLDTAVEQNWEKSLEFVAGNKRYENKMYRENYLRRRSQNRLLKRVTGYHLILSAISEKGDEAIVFFEINGKYDLTVNMIKEDGEWKVRFLIIGNPQLYYGINEIEEQIIGLLTAERINEAYDKLRQFVEILIDAPEIFYLYGLYYAMKEEYVKGREMFVTAAELSPQSYDYRYNVAFTSQMNNDLKTAKDIYQKLLTEKEDDLKTLNNMAVIYLYEGDINKSKDMWNRCLDVDSNFEPALKNLERIKNA